MPGNLLILSCYAKLKIGVCISFSLSNNNFLVTINLMIYLKMLFRMKSLMRESYVSQDIDYTIIDTHRCNHLHTNPSHYYLPTLCRASLENTDGSKSANTQNAYL